MSHLKGGNAKRALLATTGDLSPQRSAKRKRGLQRRGFNILPQKVKTETKTMIIATTSRVKRTENKRCKPI